MLILEENTTVRVCRQRDEHQGMSQLALRHPSARIAESWHRGGDSSVILWAVDIELWKECGCRPANRSWSTIPV
ncbi:MAG TPA: hypothetical protein VFA32_14235, partial [Dehalococcoidia bacterium]|nr:hypothetical protein [Dehalococcoidia bacterium]